MKDGLTSPIKILPTHSWAWGLSVKDERGLRRHQTASSCALFYRSLYLCCTMFLCFLSFGLVMLSVKANILMVRSLENNRGPFYRNSDTLCRPVVNWVLSCGRRTTACTFQSSFQTFIYLNSQFHIINMYSYGISMEINVVSLVYQWYIIRYINDYVVL